MKHPRRNCMRNCEAGAEACCATRGWRQGQIPRKVARNSIARTFYNARKHCNSNDLNPIFEIVAGELRAKLLGGGGAWPDNEPTHQATRRNASADSVEGAEGTCRGAGGRRRDLPRCRWAAAGPGRASRRRAERSSQRGRRAGGPPPTGTHSGRGLRRPQHPWGHKHPSRQPTQRKRAAAQRAAARSHSQWSTQHRRAATTSATWTAFRAAPLRRLSPETTRTRPRLPSTAWA